MIDSEMRAILVKTCSMGLKQVHLGKTIAELQPEFTGFANQFGFNVCGEGGEYETAVLDCPLFKKSIRIKEESSVQLNDDQMAPVCVL